MQIVEDHNYSICRMKTNQQVIFVMKSKRNSYLLYNNKSLIFLVRNSCLLKNEMHVCNKKKRLYIIVKIPNIKDWAHRFRLSDWIDKTIFLLKIFPLS